uniref:RecA family profile 1 domain-containing protein n=1 Tax=Dunaliella tertiolecta TaxID=3047 RepID=A0A7S3QXW9_DUNTE
MEDQVYDRAARMGLGDCSSLYVLSDYRMEVVCEQVYKLRPAALVIDSIQTMSLAELNNPMGSPIQLVECCKCLKQLARDGMAVFTIGHMTKNNQIAGPKAMIHMVDVVLRLEEDMSQAFRMLRADKNRNGSTAEMGVFSMEAGGMRAVEDLSAQFLASRSTSSVSSALTVTMDSARPLAMEVQALVTSQPPQSQAPPIRQPSGVNRERLGPIIVSVLHKFVLKLHDQNIVVSITGGLQMREPAADLAIAVAIVSGYYSIAVPRDMVVIGEIDLGGGLRPVKSLDTRLAEVAKLGIKSAVIPKPHYPEELTKLQRDPRLQGLDLLPCTELLEAMRIVLGKRVGQRKGAGTRQTNKGTGGRGKHTKSKSRTTFEVVDIADDETDEAELAGQSDNEEEEEDEQGEPWEKEMDPA